MGGEGQSADDAAATLSRFVILQLLLCEEQLAHKNHHTQLTVVPEKQPLRYPGLSSAAPTPSPPPIYTSLPLLLQQQRKGGTPPKIWKQAASGCFCFARRSPSIKFTHWSGCLDLLCVPCTSALTSAAGSGLLLCRVHSAFQNKFPKRRKMCVTKGIPLLPRRPNKR